MDNLVKEFYQFFKDGFEFEIFLKEFLKDLGFQDIKVTQKTRDGGIDLICYKDIINGLDGIESEKFIVQAKKYESNISPEKIRALNDARNIGKRKLFITTSDFTTQARKEASEMPDMTLISGKDIIKFYINSKSDKIFDWEPKLSKEKIELLVGRNENTDISTRNTPDEERILRVITQNDIRARIIRIPNEIFDIIKENKKYKVLIDGKEDVLSIIPSIKSFAGVTKYYRNHNYINGEKTNKTSYWKMDTENHQIVIELCD